MPFIRISLAGPPPSVARINQLQARTTALMANVLGKRPELTVVAVESVSAPHWSVGGSPLTQETCWAQMEAFITAGTNDDKEKAAFIAAANEMLETVLGAKISPLYVILQEIPASDWGFDGKTQAARRQNAHAL